MRNDLDNVVHKHYPTPWRQIKDNGIDKRIVGVVVYKRYMSHPQFALDMTQIF